MINLRPSQGNRTRGIDDPEIRKKIIDIVKLFVCLPSLSLLLPFQIT
ncbi:MAG: hypothetical protein M1475_03635 [Actinobacteria bacterium]|nr:hypothetical protein [Actinomycetota bacterium]